MKRLAVSVAAAGLLVAALACSSPTTAEKCGDGTVDVPPPACTPVQSGLRCVANVVQHTCTPLAASTQWTSLEPDIAAFPDPTVGFLKVRSGGLVEILYIWGFERTDPIAYTVAPGSTPEQMVRLGVVAVAGSVRSSSSLADVTIHIQPERGPEQTDQTNQHGSCQFWVYSVDVQITATKDGYAPATITSTVGAPDKYFQRPAVIALTPLP